MSEKTLDLFENMDEPPNNVIHGIILTVCASLHNERAIVLGSRLYRDFRNDDKYDTSVIGSMLIMLRTFSPKSDNQRRCIMVR